jgi:hypothetical protein
MVFLYLLSVGRGYDGCGLGSIGSDDKTDRAEGFRVVSFPQQKKKSTHYLRRKFVKI